MERIHFVYAEGEKEASVLYHGPDGSKAEASYLGAQTNGKFHTLRWFKQPSHSVVYRPIEAIAQAKADAEHDKTARERAIEQERALLKKTLEANELLVKQSKERLKKLEA